jgi:glycerol-3-phosphate dehydrogenase
MAEEAVDEAMKTFNLEPKTLALPDISGANLPGFTTNGSCISRHVRLLGSHGFTPALESQLMEAHNVDASVAHHLATNYGDRAWALLGVDSTLAKNRLLPQFPFIEAEIIHAVRSESACTVVDAIARRTRLSFLDVKGALEALPRIMDLMANELKWNGARREKEWNDTVRFLESMGLEHSGLGLGRGKAVKASESAKPGRTASLLPQGAL